MKIAEYFLITVFILVTVISSNAQESLTWEDCIKEAKKNHPDLVSAEEKFNQAKFDRIIASSSSLPDFSISINSSSSNFSPMNFSYNINTQILIFDGFKTSNSILQADERIKFYKLNYDSVSSNVRFKLKTAFINLLKSQEFLKIARDIAKRRKESADMVKLRYEAGREHKGSLLIAQANQIQAEYDVSAAERDLELAQKQLSKELGRDKFSAVNVKGDFNVKFTEKVKPDFNALAESNPSLNGLRSQKKSAEYGVNSANSSYFPSVYLSLGYGKNIPNGMPVTGGDFSAGIGLSFNIFDFGGRDAQISKARSLFIQSDAEERGGRNNIIFSLEDAWTQLQNSLDQINSQKKFLEANIERTKIAEAQYSEGLITFDNWIIIEDNLVGLQKSFLNAQAGALNAEASWINSNGNTLDYDLK